MASPPNDSAEAQRPPNFEASIEAEYAIVRRKATREAMELFIRRHPGHKLAIDAQRALDTGRFE